MLLCVSQQLGYLRGGLYCRGLLKFIHFALKITFPGILLPLLDMVGVEGAERVLNLGIFSCEPTERLDRLISLVRAACGQLVGEVYEVMIEIGSLLNAGLAKGSRLGRPRDPDPG